MTSTATPTSRSAAPSTPSRPGARRRTVGLAPPVAALFLLVAVMAGCGSSSPSSGVAHIGNAGATTTSGGSGGGVPEGNEPSAAAQEKMVKFSQCMRTHGEPEFPEPTEGGIAIRRQNGHGPNPESPQFKAAEKACRQYAPVRRAPSPAQQAKIQEQALKLSQCMRQHGVPNFPTPEFSAGGAAVRMKLKAGKGTGIEPGSPQFQAAQKTCQGDAPLLAKGGTGPALHVGGPGPKGGSQSSQSIAP